MSYEPTERPADPEQPLEGGFAEGEAQPEDFPEEERVGTFSEGQEELPEDEPEKVHHGRFSEGQEELPEEDPERVGEPVEHDVAADEAVRVGQAREESQPGGLDRRGGQHDQIAAPGRLAPVGIDKGDVGGPAIAPVHLTHHPSRS